MSPPPTESPPQKKNKTRTTPIVVGYNPRKVGRYHLLPNPRPNANRDFRMLDSVTTEDLRQTQCNQKQLANQTEPEWLRQFPDYRH